MSEPANVEYLNHNKMQNSSKGTVRTDNARTSTNETDDFIIPWYESVRRSATPGSKSNDYQNNKFQSRGSNRGYNRGFNAANTFNAGTRDAARKVPESYHRQPENYQKASENYQKVPENYQRQESHKRTEQRFSESRQKLQENQKKFVEFWNQKVLDYIIEDLGFQNDQKPFKPYNQNAEQIVIDEMGFSVQTRKALPDYLLKLGVVSSFIENSLIYQVDTVYSLWHSILALIYPDYLFLDYERKRLSVMRFRDTVNSEFINNQKLRNEIQMRKLRLVHVENSISQEKIQDEVLLRFFAIFFDINIYLVDENSGDLLVYHNLQNFTGKPINGISGVSDVSASNVSDNSKSESKEGTKNAVIELYNPYKSSILLFRFAYGNIAPVFQEGRSSQILTSTTDPGFILPISSRFLGTNELPVRPPDAEVSTSECIASVEGVAKEAIPLNVSENQEQEQEQEQKQEQKEQNQSGKEVVKQPEPIRSILKPIAKLVPRKKEPETSKEDAKERFISTMLKLKWEELSDLAEKETINPMQPTTKGFNSWKKKTKNQLAEELWEATENSK